MYPEEKNEISQTEHVLNVVLLVILVTSALMALVASIPLIFPKTEKAFASVKMNYTYYILEKSLNKWVDEYTPIMREEFSDRETVISFLEEGDKFLAQEQYTDAASAYFEAQSSMVFCDEEDPFSDFLDEVVDTVESISNNENDNSTANSSSSSFTIVLTLCDNSESQDSVIGDIRTSFSKTFRKYMNALSANKAWRFAGQ